MVAGLVFLEMRSVPVIMPYSPLSLAIASSSRFHDVSKSGLDVSEFVNVVFWV